MVTFTPWSRTAYWNLTRLPCRVPVAVKASSALHATPVTAMATTKSTPPIAHPQGRCRHPTGWLQGRVVSHQRLASESVVGAGPNYERRISGLPCALAPWKKPKVARLTYTSRLAETSGSFMAAHRSADQAARVAVLSTVSPVRTPVWDGLDHSS